jgi:hypothetical protein
MSIRYMTLAFHARVGNPLTKLILVKLADHADDDGTCWPSIRRIAHDAECDERTVRRHIRNLEAAGFLVVERRTHDGVNLPSLYRLTFDGVGAERPHPWQSAPRVGAERPQGWGQSAPLTVNTKPSIQPAAAVHAAAPLQVTTPPPASTPATTGKRRRVRPSGIVTWTQDDEPEADRIERDSVPDDLASAIKAVLASGRQPVPGIVAHEIERIATRRAAEAAAQARREAASATPPTDPDAAKRGLALISRLRARRAPPDN